MVHMLVGSKLINVWLKKVYWIPVDSFFMLPRFEEESCMRHPWYIYLFLKWLYNYKAMDFFSGFLHKKAKVNLSTDFFSPKKNDISSREKNHPVYNFSCSTEEVLFQSMNVDQAHTTLTFLHCKAY